MALQQQVTTTDLDLVLRVAQQGDRWQSAVAFRGLQRLAHPASFPILGAFFESSEAQPEFLYGAAVRAVAAFITEEEDVRVAAQERLGQEEQPLFSRISPAHR